MIVIVIAMGHDKWSYWLFMYYIISAVDDLQAVNVSDLLCVVSGFRVWISQKCIFLFVCYLLFLLLFFMVKKTYFAGVSLEKEPQTHPFSGSVCLTLGWEC